MLKFEYMRIIVERAKQTGFFKALAFTAVLFIVLGNFVTDFRNAKGATTLYYNNATFDGDWGNLANWWTDELFVTPAEALPVAGDDIIVSGDISTISGSCPEILNTIVITNSSISVPDVTCAGPALTTTGGAIFNGASYLLDGSISGDATFNDSSTNNGDITGTLVFNGSSTNENGGSSATDVTFNGSSINISGSFADTTPTFNDTSSNYANNLMGNPIFNDSAQNFYLEFLNAFGTISGNPIFNDSASNSGPIFTDGGIARFNNTTSNTGEITGDACFATGATNNGSVSGTTTVCAPVVETLTPADDGSASASDDLVITFDMDVDVGVGNIVIYKSSDDTIFETIDITGGLVSGGGTNTITINPTDDFVAGESYYVQVASGSLLDEYGNSYAGIANETTWNFTIDVAPTTETLLPADNATDVAVSSNLTITFSEAVDVETGNITIYKSSDDSIVEAIDVTDGLVTGTGTDTIVINPTADLTNGVSYYIQIDATAFDDVTSSSFAGISDETTWNFTTVSIVVVSGGGGGSSPKACNDGLDNDSDSKTDYPADPGCTSLTDNNETDPIPACKDTKDNDADGKIDYPLDPGCTSLLDTNEKDPVYQCSDTIDNDLDGKIDYPLDSGCTSLLDNNESDLVYACADGLDNDSDGKIDHPDDPGCTSLTDNNETDPIPACSDTKDNDLDGKIDYPADSGCTSLLDTNEKDPVPACSDTKDNDLDGLTDYPADPGCTSLLDNNEKNTTAVCADGGDNDGDGKIDFPADPGCSSPAGLSEVDVILPPIFPVCSDGIDNDNDGFLDFPNDSGCSFSSDDTEENSVSGGGGGDDGGGGSSNNFIQNIFGSGSSLSNNGCNSVFCRIGNLFEKEPEVLVGQGETQISSLDRDVNIRSTEFCPPGIFNAAVCITNESLDYTKEVLGITVKQTLEIIDSPYGNGLTKTISIVSLVFGAVFTVLPILFTNPLSFSELALIPARLWSLLMSALGLKKKVRKWGVVYDSVTKQPLDPVYVSLQTVEGKEITSSITDIDGRYGFLVEPGKYRIVPKKTNYSFPSLKMVGKTRDEIYIDLYFGYVFEITSVGQVITKNIPMDPLTFDWNEFAKKQKKLTNFYSKRDVWLNRIADFAFSLGLIMSFVAVVSAPIVYNILIFVLYVGLMIFREIGFRQKKSGRVLRKGTDIPFAYAIVRVFDAKTKTEIISKVTDKVGKFFCLVSKGEYYVTIETKEKDGGYKKVFTSDTLKVKDGIIDNNFEI